MSTSPRPIPTAAPLPARAGTAPPAAAPAAASSPPDGDASTHANRPMVQIEPWPDPVVEKLGHDPRSPYVETYWVSILGPSTTLLLRRIAERLERQPNGFELDCRMLSLELGLGGHTGKHAVLMRSLDRSCKFGLAQRLDATIHVRRRLPSLSRRQVDRLPPDLRTRHREWEAESAAAASGPGPGECPPKGTLADTGQVAIVSRGERARQLALTLVRLGETPAAAERQLHAWRFHPTIAWEACQWAQHAERAARGESPRVRGEDSPSSGDVAA